MIYMATDLTGATPGKPIKRTRFLAQSVHRTTSSALVCLDPNLRGTGARAIISFVLLLLLACPGWAFVLLARWILRRRSALRARICAMLTRFINGSTGGSGF